MLVLLVLLVLACTAEETPDTGTGPATGDSAPVTETGTTDSVPDSATDSATGPAPATLVQHGQITCEDPTLRESEGPLATLDHGKDWEQQSPRGLDEMLRGTGLVIEDFDADGYWDVLVAHRSRPMLFRGGPDATLEEVEDAFEKPEVLVDEKHWDLLGASAGDLDGDGDPDVLLSSQRGSVLAWTNEGGTFRTHDAGLPDTFLYGESLPLGDLDGDGDLDLFVGHDSFETSPPDPGYLDGLFLNRGDGTFEDVSETLQENWRDGYTKVGVIADLDVDGDQDLYIVHHQYSYGTNRLLFNTDDGFEDQPQAGLNIKIAGMGVGLGDINDDGLPDLLVSGWGNLGLMESLAPGEWYRSEKVRELIPDRVNDQEASWACELVDLDNDGDLDAMCGFAPAEYDSEGQDNPAEQPDGLWLREGEVFVDRAAEWGMDQKRSTRSLAIYDHNGDGWLDVIKCGEDKTAVMWTARCGEAAWITLRLEQPVPNPRGIGARVEAVAGERTWTRWLTAASTSFRSSPPPQLHFGLGDVDQLDALVVHWPDGTTDTFTDVPTRQHLTVQR